MRTMIRVTFISIMISTAALALSTAIMTGFQKETIRIMQGIHADIIMEHPLNSHSNKEIRKIAEEIPDIQATSPHYYAHALVHNTTDMLGNLVMMYGIDPILEGQTTTLFSYISHHKDSSLKDFIQRNHVVIGYKLAENLHLSLGDSITLAYPPDQEVAQRTLQLDSLEVIVHGIIKTGIEELDATFIICDYSLLLELWPDMQPTSWGIKLKNLDHKEGVITSLKKKIKSTAYTWQELYPSLVSVLRFEALISFLVLSLIILIASSNLGALLFMIITSKRVDIAILRAMGASATMIVNIFLAMGFLLSLGSSLAGIIIAYVLGWLLRWYISIPLPDAYLVTCLPVNLNLSLFTGILLFVVLVSMVAVWIGSRSIYTLPISSTLRFEN